MKPLLFAIVLLLAVIAYRMPTAVPTAEEIGKEVMEAPRRERARIDEAYRKAETERHAEEEKVSRAKAEQAAAAARKIQERDEAWRRFGSATPKPLPATPPPNLPTEIERKYGTQKPTP